MRTLWGTASRQNAAKLLCGEPVTILMQHGPHGFGLYLQPMFEDRSTDAVRLEFALCDDVIMAVHEIGWEPAATLPFPNEDVAIGHEATVCVYNGRVVRLLSIVLAA